MIPQINSHQIVYTLIYQKPAIYEYERGHPTGVGQDAKNYLCCTHDLDDLINRIFDWLTQHHDFLNSNFNWMDHATVLVNGLPIDCNTYADMFDCIYDYVDPNGDNMDNLDNFRIYLGKQLETKKQEAIDALDQQIKLKKEFEKRLRLAQTEQKRQEKAQKEVAKQQQELETYLKLKQKYEGTN